MDEKSEAPLFTGVAKVDLQAAQGADALVGRIAYPPHCNGGEVQFVASEGALVSWHTSRREHLPCCIGAYVAVVHC